MVPDIGQHYLRQRFQRSSPDIRPSLLPQANITFWPIERLLLGLVYHRTPPASDVHLSCIGERVDKALDSGQIFPDLGLTHIFDYGGQIVASSMVIGCDSHAKKKVCGL